MSKAFDSGSHSRLREMLKLHRQLLKIVSIVEKIINNWNTVLIIHVKDGCVESGLIRLMNGELRVIIFVLTFIYVV